MALYYKGTKRNTESLVKRKQIRTRKATLLYQVFSTSSQRFQFNPRRHADFTK